MTDTNPMKRPDEPPRPVEGKDVTKPQTSLIAMLLGRLLSIYILSQIIMIPYFNWQYAQKNGFMNWLLLGEVVATAKAFVWPWYIFRPSQSSKWTVAEKKQLQHFRTSMDLRSQAVGIINSHTSKPGVITVPKGDVDLVVSLYRKSLQESQLVSDGVLRKLHEDLPDQYHTRYQPSLRLCAEAMEDGDNRKQLESQRLADEFGEFYLKHVRR